MKKSTLIKRWIFMFIKKKKINILENSIQKLNKILEEGNFVELTYLIRK